MTINNVLTDLFTGMANSIRRKTNTTEVIIADNFPDAINNIETKIDYFNDKITSIDTYAYYGMDLLKSAFVPSVTSIGDFAFAECSHLESVTILSNEVSIGENAFPNNENFALYGIVGSSLETYANEHNISFVACEQWDISATEADNVTAVYSLPQKALAIYGDGNMRDWSYGSHAPWYSNKDDINNLVILGGSVTSIGDYAFDDCTSLTSITIPDSVTSIGYDAFENCTSLTNITIPDSVTSIGYSAFSGCTSLTSVSIGNSVASIDQKAFFNCTGLTKVNITNIEAWCNINFSNEYSNPLRYAHNLYLNGKLVTDITIPDGITNISKYAFIACSDLINITIPNSIKSIGRGAFHYCTSLENIYYNAVNATVPDASDFNYIFTCAGQSSDGIKVTIGKDVKHIPVRLFYPYYSSLPKITEVVFEEGGICESIGEAAFSRCTSLTSVSIPDSVTSIGSAAFAYCTSLTSINIPDSVTSIGSRAFESCSSLTSIDVPSGITNIDDYTFSNCNRLKGVDIPEGVVSIGKEAFSNCTNLKYNIYDNGKYLGNNNNPYMGFIDAVSDNIETCTIHSDTVLIGAEAFKNCTSLTNIIIPINIIGMGKGTFENCSNLISVTIPESITSIGENTFYNCTNLTSITIPESITSIGNYAFKNCTSLTSISIPNSVTSIEPGAFRDCTSLTSIYYNAANLSATNDIFSCAGQSGEGIKVTIGKNVKHIPTRLFSSGTNDSPKITEVVFEEGSVCTSIGNSAFYNCSSLTSISIPDSVTSIGYYAFENCTSLTNITIPDSVTSIGSSAFRYCTSLTSISIPDSVTSIGGAAFNSCTSLTNIYYNAVNAADLSSSSNNVFLSAGQSGEGIKVTIGKDVEHIPAYLFYSISSPKITEVIFEEGSVCTSIGICAFSGCESLTSISIPEGVTSIGSSAFAYCTSLTSVIFEGTTEQWNTIAKGTSWNLYVPATYVQCSDGQVAF